MKNERIENKGYKNVIGFDPINYIVHHKDFENVPKILETPYVPIGDTKNKVAPYKLEIDMLKKGVFNPNLINELQG